MTGPIRPEDIQKLKTATTPEEVLKVFNEDIAEMWDGHGATVLQNDVADKIAKALNISRSDVFRRHLLDVEESYRAAGWDVEYSQYAGLSASFRFTRGRSATKDLGEALVWSDKKDEWSEAIDAAHPTRSGAHAEYATAMQMVGNRHSKGELVDLVTWLLVRLKATSSA
jgi:hypothetical protein